MVKDYVVEIEQGRVRGQEKASDYLPGQTYYSFDGIPYAKPPVGPLRFKVIKKKYFLSHTALLLFWKWLLNFSDMGPSNRFEIFL